MLRSRFILRKKRWNLKRLNQEENTYQYNLLQDVFWIVMWCDCFSGLQIEASSDPQSWSTEGLNWLSPVIYFQNTWHSFQTKDRRLKTGCSSIKRNLPLSFHRMWFREQSSSGTSRLSFCCLERILFKSTREVLHLSNLWAPTYPVSAFLEKASMVVNTEHRCILTFPFLTLWHGPKAGDTRDGGAHMHNYHSTAC